MYEDTICEENFKVYPIKRVADNLFAMRRKCQDEKKKSMQEMIKLMLNSL